MKERRDFEKRMTEKYPLLYSDMYGNPHNTLMVFGFSIGPGWYPLIEELSGKLEVLIKPIRDEANADPDATCANCGHRKKWHWFFFLTTAIRFFFKNKWKAVKNLPREVRHMRALKPFSKQKFFVLRRVFWLLCRSKWHRACCWFRLSHPRAMQVKEKFGGLRFYMTWETEEIDKLISKAEDESHKICESCGEPGKARSGSWIRTLCDKCDKQRERKSAIQ